MKIFIIFLSLLVVSCGQKKDTNTAKDDKSTTGSTENTGDKKVTEKKERVPICPPVNASR